MSAVPRVDETVWPRATESLLGLPVRIGDVTVGRIVDVLFNRRFGHALGFVVDGRGAHRHFLPWVASEIGNRQVQAKSVFALLSTSELAFYVDNGASFADRPGELLVDRYGDTVSDLGPAPRLAGVDAKKVSG